MRSASGQAAQSVKKAANRQNANEPKQMRQMPSPWGKVAKIFDF